MTHQRGVSALPTRAGRGALSGAAGEGSVLTTRQHLRIASPSGAGGLGLRRHTGPQPSARPQPSATALLEGSQRASLHPPAGPEPQAFKEPSVTRKVAPGASGSHLENETGKHFLLAKIGMSCRYRTGIDRDRDRYIERL